MRPLAEQSGAGLAVRRQRSICSPPRPSLKRNRDIPNASIEQCRTWADDTDIAQAFAKDPSTLHLGVRGHDEASDR